MDADDALAQTLDEVAAALIGLSEAQIASNLGRGEYEFLESSDSYLYKRSGAHVRRS